MGLLKDDPTTIIHKVKSNFENIFTLENGLKNVFNGAMQYLTSGLWGGIKGSYHLIEILDEINNFKVRSLDVENLVPLGYIVGLCIRAVKMFASGGRKLRRRLRK